jgi:hypothetical protein
MLSTLTGLEQVERASVPNRLYVTTLSLSGAGVRERNHRYQHNSSYCTRRTVEGNRQDPQAHVASSPRALSMTRVREKPLFLKKKSRRRRPPPADESRPGVPLD